MNVLDIIIVILLVFFLYKGFVHGLVYEVSSILSLLLGIYIAVNFSHVTESYLVKEFQLDWPYLSKISFALTFLLVVFGVHLVGKTVTKLLKMVALSMFNRILGGFFGMAKIVVILSICFGFLDSFTSLGRADFMQESQLLKPLMKLSAPILEELTTLGSQF